MRSESKGLLKKVWIPLVLVAVLAVSGGKSPVPMFERLQKLADKQDLEFGLKLSNTFPVDTTRGELPNEEMYMSGRRDRKSVV